MPTDTGYGTITTVRYRPTFIHNVTTATGPAGARSPAPVARNLHHVSSATLASAGCSGTERAAARDRSLVQSRAKTSWTTSSAVARSPTTSAARRTNSAYRSLNSPATSRPPGEESPPAPPPASAPFATSRASGPPGPTTNTPAACPPPDPVPPSPVPTYSLPTPIARTTAALVARAFTDLMTRVRPVRPSRQTAPYDATATTAVPAAVRASERRYRQLASRFRRPQPSPAGRAGAPPTPSAASLPCLRSDHSRATAGPCAVGRRPAGRGAGNAQAPA